MAKTRVEHYDGTDANGVRRKSIGAAMNDLKDYYRRAINLASNNGDFALVDVLTKSLTEICEADRKTLDAICDLQ